ncbi:MAG: hypothetical protein AB1798_12745, partial [Spirochaetota bacterium]
MYGCDFNSGCFFLNEKVGSIPGEEHQQPIVRILFIKWEKADDNKKPTHPGEVLLEDVIKPLGITITEAAQKLGVSR